MSSVVCFLWPWLNDMTSYFECPRPQQKHAIFWQNDLLEYWLEMMGLTCLTGQAKLDKYLIFMVTLILVNLISEMVGFIGGVVTKVSNQPALIYSTSGYLGKTKILSLAIQQRPSLFTDCCAVSSPCYCA